MPMHHNRRFHAAVAALVCALLLVSCGKPASLVSDTDGKLPDGIMPFTRSQELKPLAEDVGNRLTAGDYAGLVALFDKTMKKQLPAAKLKSAWEAAKGDMGAYVDLGLPEAIQEGGWEVMELPVNFERGTLIVRTVFRQSNEITGLFIREGLYKALQLDGAGVATLAGKSGELVTLFNQGNFQAALDAMFDPAFAGQIDMTQLSEAWAITGQLGAYKSVHPEQATYKFNEENFTNILHVPVEYEQASFVLELIFNGRDKLVGMYFRDMADLEFKEPEPPVPPPDTVAETEVSIPSQEGYPLSGTLTMPKDGKATAAVVLVHGSGPMDRDETMGVNKPFRDIAWALASQGVAVLRYDKITYTYGQQLQASGRMDRLTVDDETATDALSAVKFLKGQEGIDPARVFIVGHSMGAMLAPYIQSKGAGAAGLILMAGSPRAIWEIIEDQLVILINQMRQSGQTEQANSLQTALDDGHKIALRVASMTDQEALDPNNDVYSLPAWYLRHWAAIDSLALMRGLNIPVLVMQGERDRQVYADKDFKLYQDQLAGQTNISFKLYPGLNHSLGAYDGEENLDVTMDYNTKTPVDQQVLADILSFIKGH